jgi:AAA+ superfamily predicted ATPase
MSSAAVRAELLSALARLDAHLESAIAGAEQRQGRRPGQDPFAGLYVTLAQVRRTQGWEAGEPEYRGAETFSQWPAAFERLRSACDLLDFDLNLLMLALAPEVEPRYERIYAFLQDDINRKRPSINLALDLFCSSAEEKLERRERFSPASPLLRAALIRVDREGATSLLGRAIILEERIASFLLGSQAIDDALCAFAHVEEPQSPRDEGAFPVGLDRLVSRCSEEQERALLCFHGASAATRRKAAQALAGTLSARLLVVDVARAIGTFESTDRLFRSVVREAWLQNAILLLEEADAIDANGTRSLSRSLIFRGGVLLLSADRAWHHECDALPEVLNIPLILPDWESRWKYWQRELEQARLPAAPGSLDLLATSFRLDQTQISNAAAVAHRAAVLNPDDPSEAIFAAARAQTGNALLGLALRIVPVNRWEDLVLPGDAIAQLHEIASRALGRHQVLRRWGFDQRLSSGKGVTALFCGASGTGKTMAAEILARDLRLDLYKIELAGVVSKYIGETEKNLDRIFAAAEGANAILLFDEADALFGKRSEVRDSHDRYANLEISYLLQKMEQYEGVAILATNLRQNIDEAFLRRLAFTVQFPFPDESSRRRIWARIWPPETPRSEDIDLEWLARRFVLSGGNIRNIALAGAYLAAKEQSAVKMVHLLHATRREFQKMGKTLSPDELSPTAAAVTAGERE